MGRMKHLSVMLLALLLAACGATQSGGTGNMPGMGNGQLPTAQSAPTANSAMSGGMDHGAAATPGATAAGGGMDHGAMTTAAAPYDAQFIDSMMMHHQGAIDMANEALKQAERPEVKDLANTIIKAQQAEITQMRGWRTQWYPTLADTGGLGMSMGEMMMSSDTAKPFDQRFIEAMIPHHQSAVAMAKDAEQKAERQEIKTLAGAIITDQEKEIAQMQQWLKNWYGQ